MAQSDKARRAAQRQLAKEMREIRAGRRQRVSLIREQVRSHELAVSRGRTMRVLIQDGNTVRQAEVSNLTAAQRTRISHHWHLVDEYLHGDAKKSARAARQLRTFEGRQTGGEPESFEFANDTSDITRHAMNRPEDFRFNSIYKDKS